VGLVRALQSRWLDVTQKRISEMDAIKDRLLLHNDPRLYEEADLLMLDAAFELDRLEKIEAAALNLISVKGRFHSEQAMKKLIEVCEIKGEAK
jgi:hypothetical protein